MTDANAVLIEALCKRPAGMNLVTMADGTTYDFRDDGTGRQVAVITNKAHITRLLSIPEGYAYAGQAPAVQAAIQINAATHDRPVDPAPANTPQPAAPLAGSTTHVVGPDAPSIPADPDVRAAMPLNEVRELFKAVLGRNPSPRHAADLLWSQIDAADPRNA